MLQQILGTYYKIEKSSTFRYYKINLSTDLGHLLQNWVNFICHYYRCNFSVDLGHLLLNWENFDISILQKQSFSRFGASATKLREPHISLLQMQFFSVFGALTTTLRELQHFTDTKNGIEQALKANINILFFIPVQFPSLILCYTGRLAERLLAPPGPFSSTNHHQLKQCGWNPAGTVDRRTAPKNFPNLIKWGFI